MLALIAALAANSTSPHFQPLLQPWSYFVGHCWVGPLPKTTAVDTHCFESVFDGQHVRDKHVVTENGQPVYSGEALYSVHGTQVVFTYWNSLGGLGTGTAVASGDELRFTGTVHGNPTSAEEPMALVWRKVGGGFQVLDGGGAPPRLFKRVD